jgi:hypothetical protein
MASYKIHAGDTSILIVTDQLVDLASLEILLRNAVESAAD